MGRTLVLAVCIFWNMAGVAQTSTASTPHTAKSQPAETAKRPNILLIYTDDHSYRTVGCYPQSWPWVRTPQMDELARNGVRFEYAYIGTWCMPSRAALLTGHHPYGVESMTMEGTYPGSSYDPAKCPFWPKVFREHGYTTAQIGKWHTGTDTGANRDWDHQIVWNRPRYPENAGNYFYNQIIETNGGPGIVTSGYSTDNYTNWAEDFIRGDNRDAEKPWYLWVCYGAVHGPFTPAERHREDYAGVSIPVPKDIFPPRPGKPAYMQLVEKWIPNTDGVPEMKGAFGGKTVEGSTCIHGNTLNDWVRQYNQGVRALDEGIGRLVAALKESGQYDNTLIVFTSDQGFAWGQHGFSNKLAPYDATIRSPLVISMPGRLPTGRVIQHPVSGVDLVPTFFSFAGIELPWKMHGHDLKPLLEQPDQEWPHPSLTAFTARSYGSDTHHYPAGTDAAHIDNIPWYFMLRQGKYKYIRTLVENEIEELYDLTSDPDELSNLAQNPDYKTQLATLRSATINELRRTDAQIVDHLPAIKAP